MKHIVSLATFLAITATATAQDISVSEIGVNNGAESHRYYGQFGGIAAYSFATTACNVGTVPVSWRDNIKEAPVIAQNMYRIVDGRIEQLGYSFLKYSFCSLDENGSFCPNNSRRPAARSRRSRYHRPCCRSGTTHAATHHAPPVAGQAGHSAPHGWRR